MPSCETKGIKDAFINEVAYTTENPKENNEIQEFLIKCYSNIALTCLHKKEYKHAIQTCDDILSTCPCHGKALYLRARSCMEPVSAGATEYELAMKDLKKAQESCPKNPSIR